MELSLQVIHQLLLHECQSCVQREEVAVEQRHDDLQHQHEPHTRDRRRVAHRQAGLLIDQILVLLAVSTAANTRRTSLVRGLSSWYKGTFESLRFPSKRLRTCRPSLSLRFMFNSSLTNCFLKHHTLRPRAVCCYYHCCSS